jgi:chromosome segregation ATPase
VSKHDKAARHADRKEEREKGWGDLTEAALALERELRRFEELATNARKLPLDTRKGIERAARATTEAAAGQERVNATLQALVEAITVARERHEANAAMLGVRGEEIRRRADEFGTLYERYSALGEEGRVINQLVQDAAASQREATMPEQIRALVASIERIEERMAKLVDGARELGQAAIAAAVSDLAEQVDSMRQQVAAARNKLGLLRKSLHARLPDPSKLN